MTDKDIVDGKECRYWFRLNPGDYRKCALRGKNDNCDEIKDCFVKELLGKLVSKEQALVDIKELAELFCNACQEHEPEKRGRDCMYCNYGKILQKIKECEGTNE